MITTRKLKIWTIISQGLIIVGAGHGIAFLLIIEILSFPYLTKNHFTFNFKTIEDHFPVVGLTSLLGQVAMLFSILFVNKEIKEILQIFGLFLLWLSVAYLTNDATKNNYIHIALITAVPFAICTIITFFGTPLRKLYAWILDK